MFPKKSVNELSEATDRLGRGVAGLDTAVAKFRRVLWTAVALISVVITGIIVLELFT